MPGEKDPTQAISTCPYCNSSVNERSQKCDNCGQVIVPHLGQPHPRKVPQIGERYKEYGPKNQFISPISPIRASVKIAKHKDKEKDHAKEDKTIVKDVFVAEFDQCLEPKRKNRKNVDDRKEEIMRSCLDLAIDG